MKLMNVSAERWKCLFEYSALGKNSNERKNNTEPHRQPTRNCINTIYLMTYSTHWRMSTEVVTK